ncbi:MAG TPA: type II toxin-antitoxin system VapC family toxin [Thermoanaerobaculia bacterium]|nr:type II toxin-antitoxin system VapC family toxin [Thermoanaerobaculia bacterium]
MIKRYVVDASVAAKWYFREEHTERADALLEQDNEILAPALLVVEIATLAWKRARRGEISEAAADRIIAALRQVPLEIRPTAELVTAALPLALQGGLTLYDAFYVALAVKSGCPLVTVDRTLYDVLRSGHLADHALWLGDFA